jgi:hypothetical protein
MYFSTLTEIPILQALIGKGHGRRPGALAAAGRSVAQPAEHAGDPQGARHGQDCCLRVLVVVVYATLGSWVFGLIW